MKRVLLATLPALALSAQSHALMGVAVSGGVNSTSISSSSQTLDYASLPEGFKSKAANNTANLVLNRGKLSGLTQVGVKAWLELPIIPVDIEAAENLGWGSYNSDVTFNTGDTSVKVPLNVKSPVPGVGSKDGATPYFSSLTDLTVRYRLFELPPLSPIKPLLIWVGAGATYAVASRVVDKSDLKDVFAEAGSFDVRNPDKAESTFKNKLTTNTMGGHLAAGVQFKVPILPLAFFVDGKWYLHVGTSDAATKYPFAANAGLGLAI